MPKQKQYFEGPFLRDSKWYSSASALGIIERTNMEGPRKAEEVMKHIALFVQMQLPDYKVTVLIDTPEGEPVAATFHNYDAIVDAVMSVNKHISKLAENAGHEYKFYPIYEENQG